MAGLELHLEEDLVQALHMIDQPVQQAARELIVPPYRVVYRHSADQDLVQVVAVYHGAQLMPSPRPDA